MKKVLIGFVLGFILVLGTSVFKETNEKNNSFSTPILALNNVKNPKLEVLEIIDTKYFEEKSTSYVFFYSEVPKGYKNYLGVSIFNKDKYGWQFSEMFGVGNIDKGNVGDSTGADGYRIGFATDKAAKVKLGTHEAEIILLKGKGMKAWLFHGINSEQFQQNDLLFLDELGNVLASY